LYLEIDAINLIFFAQILECNVIKYFSKDDYNKVTAAILVGAKNTTPFYVSSLATFHGHMGVFSYCFAGLFPPFY